MEKIKKILECINSVTKIISVISVGVGAVTVALYCLKIEFYPVGLSISDAMFLIFIMLGLVITLIVGTVIGCFSTLFIFPLVATIRTKCMGAPQDCPFGEKHHYEKTGLLLTITSLFLLIIFIKYLSYIIWSQQELTEGLSKIRFILSFVFGGFLLGLGLKIFPKMEDGTVTPLRKSKSNIILICVAFFTPIILGSAGKIIQAPFSYFGIRDQNATVSIDAESWKKIKYITQLSKIEPDVCQYGKDLVILKNSEILWSKIGDQALIRVFGKDKLHNTAFVDVEVPTKKVSPIKVGNTQIECTL